jgi:hypothetical protein
VLRLRRRCAEAGGGGGGGGGGAPACGLVYPSRASELERGGPRNEIVSTELFRSGVDELFYSTF